MESTTRGFGLIGMALLIGLTGDVLLRAGPWGINFPIWLSVAALGSWALLPEPREQKLSAWPVYVALGFAALTTLRDSPFLRFWDTVAILVTLLFPVLEAGAVRLGAASVSDFVLAVPRAALSGIKGFFSPVSQKVAWGDLDRFRFSASPLAIGLTLAVPTLFVFGGLLMSADRGFANSVESVFRFDLETVASHFFTTAFLSWVTAGYVAPLLASPKPIGASPLQLNERLGIVEVGIPLGTLTLLFGWFLAVQVHYLFGGEAAMNGAGLTYAEYAREGFTQISVASALVLPLVLGANWVFKGKTLTHLRFFRGMSIALVGLVGLLMVSALHRIALYVGQYGLSEIRFYATAFMFWLAVVNVLLVRTVLRGRPTGFAFSSVVSGFGVLAVLNFANPDAIIARSQIARSAAGAELDSAYLSNLSADAIPVVAEYASRLTEDEACQVWNQPFSRWTDTPTSDWRSWNLARHRARREAAETASAWQCPPESTAAQPAPTDQ